jgi:hypothetical protein
VGDLTGFNRSTGEVELADRSVIPSTPQSDTLKYTLSRGFARPDFGPDSISDLHESFGARSAVCTFL